MPTVPATAPGYLPRDRSNVVVLNLLDHVRAMDAPASLGSVSFPFDVRLAGALVSARQPALPAPNDGSWKVSIQVAGVEVGSATVTYPIDPTKAIPITFTAPTAIIPAGTVVQAWLITVLQPIPIDLTSVSLWYISV